MTATVRRVLGALSILVIVLLVLGASFFLRPLSFADAAIRYSLWRGGATSRYVTAGGHRMHYFEATRKGGAHDPPLLLIHGLGARGEDWSRLLPGLAAAGFHVYAPDLLGYGRSDQPDASYTIAYEEAAITHFMEAVNLPHAKVGAWSMGGWIAMRLAADHPALVERLVLYDSAGVYFPLDYQPSLFTPTNAAGFDELMVHLTPAPQHLPAFVIRDFLRRGAQNSWVVQRSLAAMTSGRDLMEFRLGEIHQPTAVMWGAEDRLIPPASGKKIAHGIPGAIFVPISGCGHLAPAECAAQVLPATIAFLNGQNTVR